jgi:LAO/AO transport system kinase
MPTDTATGLDSFVERIRSGDVRALARAITAIENDSAQSLQLMKALFPHSGNATVIGLTGSPGAGKSTLVDQLAREYRKENKTIGIVAVDPTSPYTGGAILGDRIRMQAHHADGGIYIRSMATRGFLGGLAPATADVATLLDAAGKDLVLIETVGVGQDEIDIVRLADVTVVILVPGMGDDVQTNKSDREGADRVEREIRAMQTLAIRRDDWTPPIVKTVATDGTGITDLVKAVASYRQYLEGKELMLRKKISNWRERLVEMLRKALLDRVMRERLDAGHLNEYAREIAEHRRDPYSLVEELVGSLGEKHV